MPKLYFMHREFHGHSWAVCEMLEEKAFWTSLIFEDSWYFLRQRFFWLDGVASETSAAVQTHLYNLAAVLYRDFATLVGDDTSRSEHFLTIITELVDVAEYSSTFPVCLWSYGDETTCEFLHERLAPLPSPEQMAYILDLPHMRQHELERVPYRYSEPKASLKRYRKELADYNRRCKLAAKNDQRTRNTSR